MPEEVRLRDVIEADLPVLFEHQLDPEGARMAAFAPRDRDGFTAHWRRILADPTLTARAVLADGEVAGNVVCFEQEGQRLVGYWIGRDHWGKGVATRALAAFLLEMPDRPLYAHVAAHNVGSIRVLEKCGFRLVERRPALDAEGDAMEELVMRLGQEP